MMKNLNKVFGIVLYVFASFLLIYAIWALTHNIGYIGELISSGQLEFAGNEYDIISFYMTSCGQYVIYTIVLFALGRMISMKPDTGATYDELSEVKKVSGEEELDDWFNEPTGEK